MGPGPLYYLDSEIHHAAGFEGVAIVRIALAGADDGGSAMGRRGQPAGGNSGYPGSNPPGGLIIGVNGQTVGTLHPVATNALRYNTDMGVWYKDAQKFDASLLKAGENSVTFTVPAGDLTTSVVWDHVRLELNDGSNPYPTLSESGRVDAQIPPVAP
jgi:hypothetical protein